MAPTSVLVRDALPADADALARMFGQFGYPGSPASFEKRVSKLLSDPRLCLLVAQDAGEVVGVGMLRTVDILEGDEPLGVLLTLFVDERSRRSGIGATLADALERHAREQGCFGIVVQSGSKRIAGHALYRKLGYVQTGERFIRIFDRNA